MITIDLGDGRTEPMTPSAELFGEAFATLVAAAAGWDEEQCRRVADLFAAAAGEEYVLASNRLDDLVQMSGTGDWSCQFAEDGHRAEAGAYLDTLDQQVCRGATDVAAAVLGRDLGFVTEQLFGVVTGWWAAAGLVLPPARAGFVWASDEEQAASRAIALDRIREEPGWPLRVVEGGVRS